MGSHSERGRNLGGVEYPEAPTGPGTHVEPAAPTPERAGEHVHGFSNHRQHPTDGRQGFRVLAVHQLQHLDDGLLVEISGIVEDALGGRIPRPAGGLAGHGCSFLRKANLAT